MAIITIIITTFTSFRHAFYETFLHIHIALVSLTLAALWIHLDGRSQKPYLEAVIAIWAVERFLRLSSLLYHNIGRSTTTANIEPLPGDALRITLRLARPARFKPGQHIYLTIPSIGLWTSHPFSIAWSETHPQTPQTLDPEKALATYTSNHQYTTTSLSAPQTTISILLCRRSGFTSRLHKRLSSTPNPSTQLSFRALIEGPYGITPYLSSYGTILLFAGGIGITAHIPTLRSLIASYATSTSAVRRIVLIWIIRSPEHLEWIRPWMTSILSMPKRRDVLRIQLFITRPRSSKEIHSPSAVSEFSSSLRMESLLSGTRTLTWTVMPQTVQMFPGKPSIDTLVERESREQVGAMAVSVCGPGGLGDDVRLAVRRRQSTRNIDFLEEGFGW